MIKMTWETYYGVKEEEISDLLKTEHVLFYRESKRLSDEINKKYHTTHEVENYEEK